VDGLENGMASGPAAAAVAAGLAVRVDEEVSSAKWAWRVGWGCWMSDMVVSDALQLLLFV
jgi:hypothetical protein